MSSWLRSFFGHEDWLVIPLGGLVLLACTLMLQTTVDPSQEGKPKIVNLLKGRIAKLESWNSNPLESVMLTPSTEDKKGGTANDKTDDQKVKQQVKKKEPYQHLPALLFTWSLLGILLVPIALYKGMCPRVLDRLWSIGNAWDIGLCHGKSAGHQALQF